MVAAVRLWRHLRRLPLLALPLLLLACAPKLQPLGPPIADPAFGGNQLMMNDGVALPLRHWPAEGKTKAVVLALHGFNDYSKAFEEPAKDWAKAGIETYAYDQRGFGETPYHGLWPGNQRLIEDAQGGGQGPAAPPPGPALLRPGREHGGCGGDGRGRGSRSPSRPTG